MENTLERDRKKGKKNNHWVVGCTDVNKQHTARSSEDTRHNKSPKRSLVWVRKECYWFTILEEVYASLGVSYHERQMRVNEILPNFSEFSQTFCQLAALTEKHRDFESNRLLIASLGCR
jgi:hypothetical protein